MHGCATTTPGPCPRPLGDRRRCRVPARCRCSSFPAPRLVAGLGGQPLPALLHRPDRGRPRPQKNHRPWGDGPSRCHPHLARHGGTVSCSDSRHGRHVRRTRPRGDALGLNNGARTVGAYWHPRGMRSGRDSRVHSVAAVRRRFSARPALCGPAWRRTTPVHRQYCYHESHSRLRVASKGCQRAARPVSSPLPPGQAGPR